ncbi:MAG: hypothetical protein FJ123_13120 [Deltaproteobacteria bacterium]|nr:hypothetical protein [Deltaproteobacteria bacterium]
MESHLCEVCGSAINDQWFEFCYRCKKQLCFDPTGKEQACAKSHPGHIGYYYCQSCLDYFFLCCRCGRHRAIRGRFPLKDHLCEQCSHQT